MSKQHTIYTGTRADLLEQQHCIGPGKTMHLLQNNACPPTLIIEKWLEKFSVTEIPEFVKKNDNLACNRRCASIISHMLNNNLCHSEDENYAIQIIKEASDTLEFDVKTKKSNTSTTVMMLSPSHRFGIINEYFQKNSIVLKTSIFRKINDISPHMQTTKLPDNKSLVSLLSVLMGKYLKQCYLIVSPPKMRLFFDDITCYKTLNYCLYIDYDTRGENVATLYVLGKDYADATIANLIVGVFDF